MKNTHKKIEIIDPQRWYLSFAQKRKHYVQIHSSIWSDPDFLALSSDTKVLFFWLLNASLRFNKESFSMCLESAKVTLKVSLGCIKGSLKELESNNIKLFYQFLKHATDSKYLV